jgi:hypothetical protein
LTSAALLNKFLLASRIRLDILAADRKAKIALDAYFLNRNRYRSWCCSLFLVLRRILCRHFCRSTAAAWCCALRVLSRCMRAASIFSTTAYALVPGIGTELSSNDGILTGNDILSNVSKEFSYDFI